MKKEPQLSPRALEVLPTHVAVIMDGNGRWAKERHLPRVEGHRRGVESVRAIVRAAGELGIKYLTLYAFSVENWNRPKDEVNALMKYLAHFLKNEIGELNRNNVQLDAIGQIYRLPESVQKQLEKTKAALSKNNDTISTPAPTICHFGMPVAKATAAAMPVTSRSVVSWLGVTGVFASGRTANLTDR